jgi:hypothetical protein
MKKIVYLIALVAFTFVSCNTNENIVEKTPITVDPDALYAKTEYNLDMRDLQWQ